jgi:hypothetical protein
MIPTNESHGNGLEETEDERTRREMVFQTIRPLCIRLSRIPLQLSQTDRLSRGIDEETITRDIEQLRLTLMGLGESYDSSLSYLIEYLLFPLEAILKTLANDEKEPSRGVTAVYLAIVRLYECLLDRVRIAKPTLFNRVIMVMESLKTKYSSRLMDTVTQEELVLTILNCEIRLLEHLEEELRQSLWDEQESTEEFNKPRLILAHSLGTTLTLIETTRNRELKLTGCQLIQSWATSVDPKSSHLLRKFLPGIMSGLIRLTIAASQRDPHTMGVRYIETLGIYIRNSLTTPSITADSSNRPILNVIDIDEPMNTVFSRLLDQSRWMHDQAKSVLLRLAFEMVRDYGDLIPQTTDSLLDYLVGNTISPEGILAEESRARLKCLIDEEKHNDDNNNRGRPYLVVEKLKRRVTELIDRLPSIVSLSDEEPKRMLLESLIGYLTLLEDQSRTLLESCFSRAVSSLLNLASLKRDVSLIDNRNVVVHMEDLQGSVKIENTRFSRKQFEYFNNEHIEEHLARLIELWTHYGNPFLMIEHFLSILRDPENDSLHSEAIFLLNHVVIGFGSDRTTQRQSMMVDRMIRLVFSAYMDSTVWFAPLGRKDVEDYRDLRESLSSDDNSLTSYDRRRPHHHHLSSRQLSDFALKISLMLEGIAIIAKCYNREFRGWLADCLYIMIEKLGEPNAVVSRTALCALTNVTISCDYPSIREMVLDNVDYLINTISLYLRHLEEHPRLPYMLNAIVSIMKEHFVEYMDDTFTEIFDVLDRCERRSIILEPFLCMFTTLIDVFTTCVPSAGKSKEVQGTCPSPDESMPIHETRFETYIFTIVERMIHLVSSDDPKIRQLSLDILTKVTPLMIDDRQSKFLPLVHQFWPGVIHRLDDTEHYVVLSALSLVKILIPNTQGFLSTRIGNDLWPSLKRFLSHRTTRPMSILAQAQRDPLFHYSTPFKLLHAILDLLSEIVARESFLQLKPSTIQEMMMVSVAFLDDRLSGNDRCKPIVDTTLLLFDRFSQYHGHQLFCLLLPLIHHLPVHLEIIPSLDFNHLEVPTCLKEATIHQILVNHETLDFLQTPLGNLLNRLTLQSST